MRKNLIAYFSRGGQNYSNGSIVDLKVGNSKAAAKMIQEIIGGDLFHIETVHEYPSDYSKCTSVAKKELKNNERPKILDYVHQFDMYENVFLCYPNWWGTAPMAIFTFLEMHDCSNVNIIPLCTHEGSGLGSSVSDIKKICPKTKVLMGLALKGSDINSAKPSIEEWLKKLGYQGEKNEYK